MTTKELDFIMTPTVAQWLSPDGASDVSGLAPSGATNKNNLWQKGQLDQQLHVESQRMGWSGIAAGLLQQNATVLDAALRSMEWTLGPDVACVDGSFCLNRGGSITNASHPKCLFLAGVGRAVALGLSTGTATLLEREVRVKPRLRDIRDRLIICAEYQRTSSELANFLVNKNNCNQRLMAALTLRWGGRYSRNAIQAAALNAAALAIVDNMYTTRMLVDGTLPENSGYDVNYQSVSLELLGSYIASYLDEALTPPANAVAMLAAAGAKWLTSWAADGTVLVDPGSRTHVTGYTNTGSSRAKGKDVDQYGLREVWLNQLTGLGSLVTAAAKQNKGAAFDHITGDDED